ncbi:MAG: HAMP domain-containing histidine kinase [Fibrobacterales bacterium]
MILHFLQSLYFRLFIIHFFTLFLVVVTVLVSGNLTNMPKHKEIFKSYVNLFTNYVIDDIGTPPNTVIADSIATRLAVDLVIEGPEYRWESNPNAIEHADHSHIIKKNGYTFTITKRDPFRENTLMHLYLIIGLILVIFINYLMINSQFTPIKKMREGVKEVAKGNYGIQVSTCGPKETQQLGEAFNDMSKKIEKHISELRILLRAISHELRSPLGRMKLALEFVSDKRIKESLSEEITQLDTITASLLEQEKLKSGLIELEKCDCDLSNLLNQVVQPYSLEHTAIHLNLPEVPITVKADCPRLAIVFRNLTENAIKYGENSPITISVSRQETYALISVQDHGIGIAPEDISKIGDPFFRPDSSRTRSSGGFGLGLSIAKAIITAHNGTFEICSKIDEGSTFTVTLPIC